MSEQWLTIADAAAELGITTDAVRMRARRGKLTSEKRDGMVYVRLDIDRTETEQPTEHVQTATEQRPNNDQTALVEQLQRENARLWEANERLTRLLDQEQQLSLQRMMLEDGQEATEPPESNDTQEDEGQGRWWQFWRHS